MRASAKELRSKSNQILDAVLRGEEVVITYRGKARARMIRYNKKHAINGNAHALFGMWADHLLVADVDRYVRELRKGRF
jgi:prevent-host-death family protein